MVCFCNSRCSIDGNGRIEIIRVSDHMRGSYFASEHKDTLVAWYKAYFNFCKILNLKQSVAEYKMRSGDAIMFDNRRLLHGRKEFLPLPNYSRRLYVYHYFWMDVVKKTKSLQRQLNVL